MKFSHHIGGVVSLIKDEFYGPRKYVIAYNTIHSLNKFIEEVPLHFKQCRTNKPKYAIRLCRLEKSFNFMHMMDHLASYERELEKGQLAGSSSYNYAWSCLELIMTRQGQIFIAKDFPSLRDRIITLKDLIRSHRFGSFNFMLTPLIDNSHSMSEKRGSEYWKSEQKRRYPSQNYR